jgi:hypothetical protein
MDKFMESTNHNLWTLTKNVAHSVNKTAGKIDVTIYGSKTNTAVQVKAVVPPKAVINVPTKATAPERPLNPYAPSGIGLVFFVVGFTAVSIFVYFRRRK